jgi:hypothetical protein
MHRTAPTPRPPPGPLENQQSPTMKLVQVLSLAKPSPLPLTPPSPLQHTHTLPPTAPPPTPPLFPPPKPPLHPPPMLHPP